MSVPPPTPRAEFERTLEDLRDTEGPLSRDAILALSGATRRQSERFMVRFREMTGARRRDLLSRMVEYAEESIYLDYGNLFRMCLDDPDAEVRRQAIEGLWEDERPDLMRRLLALVAKDPDVPVRAAAAASLGRFLFLAEIEELDPRHGERIRAELERLIADPNEDVEVVRRAVESIAFVNDDAARRIIGWAYDHDHPLMRVSAVFAMGRSMDPVWAETVLLEMDDRSPEMRSEAARAAGEMQLRRAVPLLARLVGESDRDVQAMAIWALGQIGGTRAQQLLVRLAASDDEVVAAAADDALGEVAFADGVLDLLVVDPEDSDLVTLDLEGDGLEPLAADWPDDADALDPDWESDGDSGEGYTTSDDEDEEDGITPEDDAAVWPDDVIDLG